jgi:hypothetical protein
MYTTYVADNETITEYKLLATHKLFSLRLCGESLVMIISAVGASWLTNNKYIFTAFALKQIHL